MRVGVLGTGDVGKALGHGFISLGHHVMMGSRIANGDKAIEWVNSHGTNASQGTFADAANFGEIVVLATHGVATPQAIQMADPHHFNGKLVLDVTNPLDFSQGRPQLVGGVGDSAGEKHQRLLSHAHVVKAFNTVGSHLMFKPQFTDGIPDMFICGTDANAKQKTSGICKDFGWGVVDVGGIDASHFLESMCMVWVLSAVINNNQWNQAFKMLKH